MITKLNLYRESILVPRNLENRQEKLLQQTIKLLSQEIIEGDLIITEEMLDIPSNLVKVKKINGSLPCTYLDLNELPEWFKNIEVIEGSFNCCDNNLISLENCPQHIKGVFNCAHNKLETLKYGPKIVEGDYHCGYNKLTTLKGCAERINGNFYCINNELTSLEYGPKYVGIHYYCQNNSIKLEKPNDCIIKGIFLD